MSKIVLIVGAGSTLSEAASKPLKSRPPLDAGFFAGAKPGKTPELARIRKYMVDNYAVDPVVPAHDSLEAILGVLYSDVYNPSLSQTLATEAFRSLLKLVNRRIAETTNVLKPNKKSNLYRIIRRLLSDGHSPNEISIITFNQDLHIERTLHVMSNTPALQQYGILFAFPYCYQLADYKVTSPTGSTPTFSKASQPSLNNQYDGIQILKLHGSLNWYSRHTSQRPSPKRLLDPGRTLYITDRRDITIDMTVKMKRTMYSYPIVVPPVIHKASILQKDMGAIWSRARDALSEARRIVVFGYSCPVADQESASLMRRGLGQNSDLQELCVVDPSSATLKRWAELGSNDRLVYYRSANTFLKSA